MRIAELIKQSYNPLEIQFKDIINDELLSLDLKEFTDFNRENKKYFLKKKFSEGVYRTLVNLPKEKFCIVEYSQRKEITKCLTYPYQLPLSLTKFVVDQDSNEPTNYGLAVGKAGRFFDKKLQYMAEGRSGLFYEFLYTESQQKLNKSIHAKQKATLVSFESQGYQPISVIKKQTWRMAIGLGEASAYNNGFTFHKVYGIPYIPGQAVQGVVRNWIITTCFNSDENEALDDAAFCYLFGKGDKGYTDATYKGKLIFLDAFPQSKFEMAPDVMNPHYGDYYQQKMVSDGKGGKVPTPPADWLNPVPIFFMTIKEATFPFHVLIREADDVEMTVEKIIERYALEKDEDKKKVKVDSKTFLAGKKPSEVIEQFLVKALSIHGIGAKTAVGYGRMEEPPKPITFREGQEVLGEVMNIEQDNRVTFKIEGSPENKSTQVSKDKVRNLGKGDKIIVIITKTNEDGTIKGIKPR